MGSINKPELSQFFIIPMAAPSLNKIYTGMHYRERARLAKDWHLIVKIIVVQQKIKIPSEWPVAVITQTHLKSSRRFDTDNSALAPKLIIDGLRHADIFPDDTGDYVAFTGHKLVQTKCGYDHTRVWLHPYSQMQKLLKGLELL